MDNADHDEILGLIPAYALSSLDGGEAEMVRAHLAGCKTCQAELAAYEGVVDLLPLAAPAAGPAPALKGRLMERIQADPVAEPVVPATRPWWQQAAESVGQWLSGPRWRPALALTVLILAIGNIYFWQEATRPSPNAWRRISLSGTEVAPEASGIIYISADGQNGAIIVDKMPQLNEAQQYQLWLIVDGERTSGAVFSVPADGYQTVLVESARPLREYESFGVTIEPAGGSPGPTGEKVLGYGS